MPAAAPVVQPFAVEFGRPATLIRGGGLDLTLPLLGGDAREALFPALTPGPTVEGIQLFTAGDLLLGCVSEPVHDERALSRQSQEVYRRVLTVVRGHHLYRIWNYVPRINALVDGFENYRAFCQGRSLAFEAEAGAGFPRVLPAASGVGSADHCLSLVFLAGPVVPHHYENPAQVPAYLYPAEHGPRAPSFSRATVVRLPQLSLTFISGTAAIKGHKSLAAGDLAGQLDCTLDNLRLISRAAEIGDDLGGRRGLQRHFKVYLRHAADLDAVRDQLDRSLFKPGDRVTYLQADICRAELVVEIEASLFG